MLENDLRDVIKSQKENIPEYGIERELLDKIDFNVPHATILSGIRRCGKSTLLRQLMKRVGKCYYLNFEDPRVSSFSVYDFQKLDEAFLQEYGESDFYFFDEIQNFEKWEIFARSLLDRRKKIVITGSNASLLSRELGTKLTGRHLRYELFPFSYLEMLKFVKEKPSINSFQRYMEKGGFPEYLEYEKIELLQELFTNIIERDVVVRHGLRDSKLIREMAMYLLTNIGKEFSYNGLRKLFNIGSTNSVVSYISYFEDSYLLFTVPRFDYSFKKQLINPKKAYSVDVGLSRIISTSFSLDKGRIFENLVFLNLRRDNRDLYYFKKNGECDFLVRTGNVIKEAIQVCYELNDENQDREISGLTEAMKMFKLKEGTILTYNQEDRLDFENRKIIVKPAWKWLLEK